MKKGEIIKVTNHDENEAKTPYHELLKNRISKLEQDNKIIMGFLKRILSITEKLLEKT